MSRLLTRNRKQKAVCWASSGYDDYGEPKVGDPTEINVRWENKRRESVDANANVIAIDATVVTDVDLAVGDCLWLGSLNDLTATVTKMEVVEFRKTPNIKGRRFRRVALLRRLSDELPDAS